MADNIVVSDAGPLHYLVLIDCAEVLARLFDHVLVPFAVRDELLHPRAPQKVRNWILQSRPWLEITAVTQAQPVHGLHKGETEALQLALERKAAAVLMDDMDGRAAAGQLGLSPIFTVAILELAAERGLIELPPTIAKLQGTNFFISQEVLDAALARDRERREKEKHG
jgi:predicted nucleic acid-binding protein